MTSAVPYYDPGPYYADPADGGSDCLCEVYGDGTREKPYRVVYCGDHLLAFVRSTLDKEGVTAKVPFVTRLLITGSLGVTIIAACLLVGKVLLASSAVAR